jgi:hypothetical protein
MSLRAPHNRFSILSSVDDGGDNFYLPSTVSAVPSSSSCLSYATLFAPPSEDDVHDEDNTLPVGWVELTRDSHGQVQCRTSPPFEYSFCEKTPPPQRTPTFHESMMDAVRQMAKTWRKYERQYDELHGDGVYRNKYYRSRHLHEEEAMNGEEEEEDDSDGVSSQLKK